MRALWQTVCVRENLRQIYAIVPSDKLWFSLQSILIGISMPQFLQDITFISVVVIVFLVVFNGVAAAIAAWDRRHGFPASGADRRDV